MGSSHSALNCTVPDGPLNADADIVGPGVFAAFFASATITIVAVLVAYLSNSLDQALISDLDDAAINRVRIIWLKLRGAHISVGQDRKATGDRDQRTEVFTRFVLALSDQQLVTGLAILIAGVSNQHRLSNYEFSVTLGLAWFSTTTHLATLSALREYFRTRKPLCHIRVSGMIAVLIFLLYVFFLTDLDPISWTVPVECVFTSSNSPHSKLIWQLPFWDMSFLCFIMALALILWGYYKRIEALYSKHSLCLYLRLWRIQRKALSTSSMIKWSPSLRKLSNSKLLEEYKAFVRMKAAQHVSEAFTSTRRRRRRRQLTNYNDPFFNSIPGIAFSYSYAIGKTVLFRWEEFPTLSDDSSQMGFGQIMSILLLVLPIFAVLEAYYDYRKTRKSNELENSGIMQRNQNESQLLPEDEFTNRATAMIEYFATDIRLIKELENSTNDSQPLSESQKRYILDLKNRVILEHDKIMDVLKEQNLTFYFLKLFMESTLCLALGVLLNIVPSRGILPSVIGYLYFLAWIAYSLLTQIHQDRGNRLQEFLLGEWILAKPFAAIPPVSTNTFRPQ